MFSSTLNIYHHLSNCSDLPHVLQFLVTMHTKEYTVLKVFMQNVKLRVFRVTWQDCHQKLTFSAEIYTHKCCIWATIIRCGNCNKLPHHILLRTFYYMLNLWSCCLLEEMLWPSNVRETWTHGLPPEEPGREDESPGALRWDRVSYATWWVEENWNTERI